MPPLDPKDEAIVAACVANGGNQSEAWRSCHPETKAKPASIHVKASAFFKQDKVRLRLAELHAEVAVKLSDDAALTLSQHMRELKELREKAKTLNQIGAAIRAEQLRGEASRFYVKQIETGDAGEFDRMSTEELRAFVNGDQAEEQTKH